MASNKQSHKNLKDLKLLKKDELIRLLVESQQPIDSPPNSSESNGLRSTDSHPQLCPTPSKSEAELNISSSNKSNGGLLAQIKTAVFEAVRDLKSELRLEYQALLNEMEKKFMHEVDSLRKEIITFRQNASDQLKRRFCKISRMQNFGKTTS